ncbi:hypothetical protein G7Y89_g1695 [Cudoniella acicularis]|uniref:Mediator of RNA polymerase II transcription subunit 4 n=1 Tax=Cudoniella acicularis TaxID=354080 RepID=A0A8H4RVV5_9HELO|nr:hypothetical protein G7Y89_g1695 [Cudoniella acicularis]
MNEVIDKRFERLDKALVTLINSISTYNPSTTLANDLVVADADLSQGLEQLSIHQSNHAKILSLRAISHELDTQIRETLTLLTSTRAELLSTPATIFPPSANTVSYSELLDYARRISKFTLPSTYREPDAQTAADTGEAAGTNTPKEAKSETQTNGTSTPVAVANGVEKDTQMTAGTAMDIDSSTPATGTQQASQNTNATSSTSLPVEFSQWLNPSADVMFVPWPTEQTIRRGALASIQMLIDQGKDPATFDPAESAALEEERRKKIEEEDKLREEEQARMEEQRRREMERRMSSSGGGTAERVQEKPSVFQLETFDDDEDD